MNNYNNFTIYGWMINELGLTGSDLVVYAYYYGLSRNNQLIVTEYDWVNKTASLRVLLETIYSFDAIDLNYAVNKLMSTGHFVEIREPDFAFRVVLPEEYKED